MTESPFKRPIRVANYNPVDEAVLVDADGNEILGVSEWLRADDAALDFIVATVNSYTTPDAMKAKALAIIDNRMDRMGVERPGAYLELDLLRNEFVEQM